MFKTYPLSALKTMDNGPGLAQKTPQGGFKWVSSFAKIRRQDIKTTD